MGLGRFAALILAGLACGSAAAAEGRAIPMTDGPGGSGRFLGDAWSMRCDGARRLAGVRLHEDRRGVVVGVEALCVRLEAAEGAIVWAEAPVAAEAREPARKTRRTKTEAARVEAADEGADGHILRVRSGETARFRGSRAMVISVPRPAEPPAPSREVSMRKGVRSTELRCPEGGYVQGLRTGVDRGAVVGVQLLCARGGRSEPVGGDVLKGASKRAVATRTECGGGRLNPHDGAAGQALIGTVENGRLLSLGLSCARSVTPGAISASIMDVRRWLGGVFAKRSSAAARVYRAPRWYRGSGVAVCRDGSGRGPCAQASADTFCSVMRGEGTAVSYVVGRFEDDVIAAGGKRCPEGACRAFQSITCRS